MWRGAQKNKNKIYLKWIPSCWTDMFVIGVSVSPCIYDSTEAVLMKGRQSPGGGALVFPLYGEINQLHHYKWHNIGCCFFCSSKISMEMKWKMGYKWKCGWRGGWWQQLGGLHKTSAVWALSERARGERRTSTRLLCVSLKPSCFYNKTMSPTTRFGLRQVLLAANRGERFYGVWNRHECECECVYICMT